MRLFCFWIFVFLIFLLLNCCLSANEFVPSCKSGQLAE